MFPIPFSDLDRPLTFTEESGILSRELGLSPNRQHAMGKRMFPRYHVAFVHDPMPPKHHQVPKK